MKIELKDCPCCGKKAEFKNSGRLKVYITCTNYGLRTKSYHGMTNAAEAWNWRV